MDVEREQRDRFRFLRSLWEAAEGSEYFSVNMFEHGEELNLDRPLIERIFRFLTGEGLIKGVDIAGGIGITHRGIIEVEKALSKPDTATEYFPPVNVISIGTMSNSVIQQASPHASQDVTFDASQRESIMRAVTAVGDRLGELALEKDNLQQVRADLATISAQMSAPTPRRGIVTESLVSLRSILEQVAAATIAAPLILGITRALGGA